MGVARAGGLPDYNPGAGIDFIPEIWSGKLVEKFYRATVFGDIATVDYEGDIVGMGAQIKIRTVPDVTVSDYTVGGTLTYQYPSRNSVTLAIDQAKSFSVALNTVDMRQSDLDLSDIFATDGAIRLKIAADADVLSTIPAQVDTHNTGATAGVDVGNINLGTLASPVVVQAAGATGTDQNVIDVLTGWGEILDEQDVTDEGRWAVVPPWFIRKLKSSDLRIASLAGDGISVIRNGRVGIIDRFMVYESRNVLKTTSPTTSFACMFGHSAGLAFASQITDAEMLPNPTDFGYLIRGLMVFGFKVIEPKYVGVGYALPGAH